jgi:hypothetical protein
LINTMAIVLIVGSLLLAAMSLVFVVANRPVGLVQLVGLGIGEAALAVQVVLAIVKLADGQRAHGGMAVFIGYLAGSLLILPVAALWGLGDRSRWGSGVVLVGYLVIAVLTVRMQQVWRGI